MMISAKVLSDQPRMLELAIIFLREPDRKRLDRPRRQFRHESQDGAGIHPPTQKTPDRHIAHHPQRGGRSKPTDQLRLRLFPVCRFADGAPGFPVANFLDTPGLDQQVVPCLQFLDLPIDRTWGRNVPMGEILVQRELINLPGESGNRQQRLKLRGKDQLPLMDRIVERLFAKSVAGQQEALAPLVPESKGKHPFQMLQTV